MKIAYMVAGEGMGHAARAHAVVEHLKEKHDVTLFAGDKSYHYLKNIHDKVLPISSLRIAYHNNTVLSFTTFLFNLIRLPLYVWSIIKTAIQLQKVKPDVVLNDFSLVGSYAAVLTHKRMITIDNQHAIPLVEHIPKKYALDAFVSRLVVKIVVPKAKKQIITSFFPLTKKKNQVVVSPILRKEILSLTPSKKDHLFVYQTSETNTLLFHHLRTLNIPCMVYGFGKEQKQGNLHFKKGQDSFKSDLASAKAVIINGGFSLLTEALYLKKPILSIPVKRQFEQVMNALQLERQGWGKHIEKSSLKAIKQFLENLPVYEEKLKHSSFSPEKALKKIEEALHA